MPLRDRQELGISSITITISVFVVARHRIRCRSSYRTKQLLFFAHASACPVYEVYKFVFKSSSDFLDCLLLSRLLLRKDAGITSLRTRDENEIAPSYIWSTVYVYTPRAYCC